MKRDLRTKVASYALMAVGFGLVSAQAAFIPLGPTNYFQSFDTLAKFGAPSKLPTGWAVQRYFDGRGDNNYFADDGSMKVDGVYSYGQDGRTDRAPGTPRSYPNPLGN